MTTTTLLKSCLIENDWEDFESILMTLVCNDFDVTVSTIERMPAVGLSIIEDWKKTLDSDGTNIFKSCVRIDRDDISVCKTYLEEEGFSLAFDF